MSRAIRRLGGESLAVYPSGGPVGEILERFLDEEEVAQRPVPVEGWTRENSNIYETSADRQYRFLEAGPELDEEEEEACRELVEGGCGTVVLSLGAAGALLFTAEGAERLRSPQVPIRSRIGAGDSMVAGIVLGLERGMEIGEAVRYGIAAGAAAVRTPGTELCRRRDVERLFRVCR